MIKTLHRSSKCHSRCSNRALLRESALCCSGRSVQSGSKPKTVKNHKNASASSICGLSGGRHCSANPDLQPAVVPNAGAVAMVTWQDHVYNKGCIWEQLWRKKVSSSERFHQSSEEGVLKERKLSRSQSVCSPANFTHIHPYFIVPLRSQTDQVMKKQTVGSCGELILKEEESTCLIKGPGKPHRCSDFSWLIRPAPRLTLSGDLLVINWNVTKLSALKIIIQANI